MSGFNSSQQTADQLETELLIALTKMIEQYDKLDDNPFWVEWDKQEKVCYRNPRPHLAMPKDLRDEAIRLIAPRGLIGDVPAELMAMGLTSRQSALTEELVKLAFIYLTSTHAKVGAVAPDGTMDNLAMGPGEYTFGVLKRIGLVTTEPSRFANWTEEGRDIVRLFKVEIADRIQEIYSPEFIKRMVETGGPKMEKIMLRFRDEKMDLWLFK